MLKTEIAIAKPFEGAPHINLCGCYGASPNKPILLKIPVTGQRPITYTAENLPKGLSLQNGILSGAVSEEGEYELTLTAENALGRDTKQLSLEIKKDTVLLSPLLGFTSWNAFAYAVTQEDMEKTAHLMTDLGISEYGYSYINVDSGWQGEYGGKFDAIMPNEKFPDMKGMCDRLHAMGFKCGIYSTPMLHAFGCSINHVPLPPGCTQGEPDDRFADERGGIGLIRKEKNNALQWSEWGFDYLKYDWRPSDPYNAELMRKELVETDRDFGFCVTVKARPEYHTYWSKYCNSYRCNVDSTGSWQNLMEIYRTYFDYIDYINKGHFFDLDMLETGYCELFHWLGYVEDADHGLTEDEQIVAFTMRAFLNSPIQLSCQLDKITEFELSLYCNEEILAINQDSGFFTAKPYMMIENDNTLIHIFRKKLANGDFAIAAFNLGDKIEETTIYLDEVCSVRDVWAKKDQSATDTLKTTLYPHTVRVFRLSQEKNTAF